MSICPREMIESSQSEDDLRASLRLVLENFDIERFSFVSLPRQPTLSDKRIFNSYEDLGGFIDSKFQIFHTYSQIWVDHYTKEKYYLIDPVYVTPQQEYIPYIWREEHVERVQTSQKKLFNEARDFNISKGITLNFGSSGSNCHYLTLLDHVNFNMDLLHIIRMASYDFLRKQQEFDIKRKLKNISSVEYLILALTAEGVPQKSIASHLNINEHMLQFSIKKIRKKFNNASLHALMFYLGLVDGGYN